MPKPKRHLRAVPDQVSLDTAAFDAIPDEDELDALLDEVSDEEFGAPELKDAKPVKLKEWKAEEFASIYVRFRPHLERHARKWLKNPSQIDEVVQDAFLYLMVSLPELDSEIGVLKFMKWKVKNLCLDIYRAQGRAYINNIDDIAEPASTDPEVGSQVEQAEDAAVVKLALSKLNPRHREVLLASIYEEKSTAEIAAQVGLSENATLQLMFRARAAFKKALLGDVDTEGMSMAAILSVATRKAAEEAKKVGVQAMVLVLFLALGIGALFNFNRAGQTGIVAQPGVEQPNNPAPAPHASADTIAEQASNSSNTLKVNTAANVEQDVPLVEDFYQVLEIKSATATKIVSSTQNAAGVVYKAAANPTNDYILDAENGVKVNFTMLGSEVSHVTFEINADGILYYAGGQNVQVQVVNGVTYVAGRLTDLVDVNGLVYGGNALSRALFQMHFVAPDRASDASLTLNSTN